MIQFCIFLLFAPQLINASQPLNLQLPKNYHAIEERENMFAPKNQSSFKTQKLIIVIGNDGISGNLSDRHLTSQIKIGKITKRIPKAFQSYIEKNDFIIMTLSHDIYTPEDIENENLIIDDIPYAGWLYLTLGSLEQTENKINITTVDIGIVGPSAQAEWAQTEIHALVGSDNPNGWSHQLKDELGIRIEHERYFRTPFTINSYISGELLKFYGGTLGNVHTGLKAGGAVRVGRNIPDDLTIGVNSTHNKNISVFGFIKVQGEFVLRNIFLDGNTFKDSHSVEKENFIAEISAGITIMKGVFGVSLIQSIKTKEYVTQKEENTNAEIRLVFDFVF